nr:ADP-ribosylglycohydrolase family protein [Aneurinibacillus sp. UBA3580]
MLGLAIGDCVGVNLEFKPPGSFQPITDIIGGGSFHLQKGEYTDDTSMALCLAESLIENNGFNAKDQMNRYVKWYREGYMSSIGRCSELKTDLGIERLPSGLFATNHLVLHLALFAYNLLRIIGQESLKEDDHPLRKRGKRRRIRTVIQTMITLASKVVRHARQFYLRFGRTCAWFPSFTRIY